MGLSNPTHIVALLLIALLLFGAKRLPEIGRSLGLGMREFKDSVTGHEKPEPAQITHAPLDAQDPSAAAQSREGETVH